MIRKLLAVAAFSIVVGAAINAQDAPKDKVERRVQVGGLIAPFERSY